MEDHSSLRALPLSALSPGLSDPSAARGEATRGPPAIKMNIMIIIIIIIMIIAKLMIIIITLRRANGVTAIVLFC